SGPSLRPLQFWRELWKPRLPRPGVGKIQLSTDAATGGDGFLGERRERRGRGFHDSRKLEPALSRALVSRRTVLLEQAFRISQIHRPPQPYEPALRTGAQRL